MQDSSYIVDTGLNAIMLFYETRNLLLRFYVRSRVISFELKTPKSKFTNELVDFCYPV